MSKTLNIINGETLMNTFIPPIEFVVKDLIAQGLHVLSGSPKTGKSWFALMLCLKVATGEMLWKFETKQGAALYLCLEDSIARIQSRLFDITDDAPSDIYFATVAECIGYGIEEQIENFCKEHPNTRLVVIDTFQKIRTLSNDNAYASDYHDVSFLKSIADKLKIVIVLIHHLRKQKDDDPMNMVREYVRKVGDIIIDEFLEDNISGTLYDRPGIKRMYELADSGMIDTVYIKDLSRLSRDRFYTLLIVRDMKERNVRIVSVTEGIDSFNRSDDLIIGFKGLINDSYVQDIIVKILAALRHKQEFEGMIINVPMGYLKDRYTKKVEICEETADIIRRIYKLFLDGHGTESVAKILNKDGVKTPAYYELKLKGKKLGDNKPKATFEYLWTYSIVRRILTNPFYCGDLVNHQRERSRITKKQIKVPKEEQFIHRNAVPAIIPRDIWDKVQEIIRINSEGKVKSQNNQPCHRYASLLKCGDCGSTFTAKRRKTKGKPDRIEYVCNGYHRHTHMVCSSHRINESVLDEEICKQLAIMRDGLSKCSRQIERDIRSWMSQKNNVTKKIKRLNDSINATELEVEQILMEKIKDRDNAERYERMIEKRNREIEGFKNEIAKIENIDKTIKERKKAMLENANLLDKILSEKELSHTNLCLLIEKIIIYEDEYGLRLEILMKAPFLEKSYTDEIGMICEDNYEVVSA